MVNDEWLMVKVMSYLFSFENLDVWKEARLFVSEIYSATNKFPASERFGLTSQINRAAVSIASNIAEGSGRSSAKDKIHFLEIAYSSLLETYCQLQLAVDLNYLSEKDFDAMKERTTIISKMLSGLRNHFKHTLTSNP